MKGKYSRLLGDTLIFAIGNVGSKLILFFLVPLYTNVLTQEEYGTADLVFTVAELIVPFVSVVIFDAVIRFGLSKYEKPEDVLVTGFVVLGVGSVVTVLLSPLVGLYAALAPWRWYLCIQVILMMFVSVMMNYLKVLNRNEAYAVTSIVHTAVMALLNILLLTVVKLGVQGYLIATIVGNAVTVIIAFFAGSMFTALKNGRVDSKLAKRMIAYSAPLILNNVSWWVIQSSNKLMVEIMIGTAALGLYTVATKIPSFINVIISIFSQAWGVATVKELESDNDNKFYADVFGIYSVIAFGASVALNTIVKPFMGIYVGADFIEAWRYVPLLLVSASFSAISSYYGSLYGALKKSVRNMTTTLIAAAVNLTVNIVGIMMFGIWGVLIGTVAAYMVIAYIRMIDVLRFIRFNPNWKVFISNSIIVLAQAIAVSLEFHIYVSSAIAIAAFIIVNHKTLYSMIKKIVRIK